MSEFPIDYKKCLECLELIENNKQHTFDEYQKRAAETAIYRKGLPMKNQLGLIYPSLGLNGEAGEVAECVKKMIRDDNAILTPERREKLLYEMGDVLWYLAALATELNENLSTVADLNIAKLGKRYQVVNE